MGLVNRQVIRYIRGRRLDLGFFTNFGAFFNNIVELGFDTMFPKAHVLRSLCVIERFDKYIGCPCTPGVGG